MNVLIDTDCGTDDLMGITYLVSHPDVKITGVTTVHGLTSTSVGATNVRRLLNRLGASSVPVFAGSEFPIGRPCAFPTDWRLQAESLSGVSLPLSTDRTTAISAVEFIADQLRASGPPIILALGPWTNIEYAIESIGLSFEPKSLNLFAMGGAFDTHGNVLSDAIGGDPDPHAEWNFYLDPKVRS